MCELEKQRLSLKYVIFVFMFKRHILFKENHRIKVCSLNGLPCIFICACQKNDIPYLAMYITHFFTLRNKFAEGYAYNTLEQDQWHFSSNYLAAGISKEESLIHLMPPEALE